MRDAQRLRQLAAPGVYAHRLVCKCVPLSTSKARESERFYFNGPIRQTTKLQDARTGRTIRPAGQVTDKHALRMKSRAALDQRPKTDTDLLRARHTSPAPALLSSIMIYTRGHYNQSVNQSINIFNVLGRNWDPADKKFSSVNPFRQTLLPTRKAFP